MSNYIFTPLIVWVLGIIVASVAKAEGQAPAVWLQQPQLTADQKSQTPKAGAESTNKAEYKAIGLQHFLKTGVGSYPIDNKESWKGEVSPAIAAMPQEHIKIKACFPEIDAMSRDIENGKDMELLLKNRFMQTANIDLFIEWLKCNHFNVSKLTIKRGDTEFRLEEEKYAHVTEYVNVIAILPKNTLTKSQESNYSPLGGGIIWFFKTPTIWDQLHASYFQVTFSSLPDAQLLDTSYIISYK